MSPVKMEMDLSTLVERLLKPATYSLSPNKARLTCHDPSCLIKTGRPRVLGYVGYPITTMIQGLAERGQTHDAEKHGGKGDIRLTVTTTLRG